ncbi:hypothetical protein CMUS01_12277 [Colletotrichum musicola]|uniref:Uncharacterized protein n=1 Tax=Colletotrichum musicola TaxID=2175873 RepID=A0A8H6JPQ8_9PEZI|nr:hypothetical protein CMUS01_12277 [Colletotrichum musicola]
MQGAPFDPVSLGPISTAAAAAGRGLCIRLRRSILDSVQLASTVERLGLDAEGFQRQSRCSAAAAEYHGAASQEGRLRSS